MLKPASLLLFSVLPLAAQGFHNNQDRTMVCEEHDSSRPHSCEIREQSIPASSSLQIDAGANGGVTVKGWDQPQFLVRSKVEAWAHSFPEAKSLASAISIEASGGSIRPHGPETNGDHRGWSVSFEIFAPHNTNFSARANNGGIHVSDFAGNIDLETTNGGLNLARVQGNVKGVTTNGGVTVALMGDRWDGQGLDVSSTNGGITVKVPDQYSAHLEGGTVNGGIHSDFGDVPHSGRMLSFQQTLGSGGPTIHFNTVNGAVHIGRFTNGDDM